MHSTTVCYKTLRGRMMRLTKLDGCGNRVLGPKSVITSKGFITVTLDPQIDTGEPIQVRNANGDLCMDEQPTPRFTHWQVGIEMCGVNPDMLSVTTSAALVLDAAGTEAVGFGIDDDVDLDLEAFALELWAGTPSGSCDVSGDVAYGYTLIPFIKGGVLGQVQFANAAINLSVTNAQSKTGNQWGVGPFDVVRDAGDVASPLNVAIPSTRHFHQELTTVAPPVEACGASALGTLATGATAGIPGAFTPANSYAPNNLAGMSGVTASPLTAWTTGQYVTLLDGSTAHWTSSAWAAGPA